MGFLTKALTPSLDTHLLNISLGFFILLNCIATACIISDQCRSAAENVKNHGGIPIECNIASMLCNSFCPYGGDPQIFLRNLYAC